LASLPHVPERQQRQWDVASFVTATVSLGLSTYNTVQISKLESAIETQKQNSDLLADIVHIHEQHLHQLDRMIDVIGNEIAKLKVQAGFHFSVDRAIAQVISDSNKLRAVVAIFERVINSAFDQKLAPGALSVDVLDTIVHHIKDTAAINKFHNFIHQPSDLYKLETSFIHHPEEFTVILILHVPYVENENLLPLYEFISLPIYFNFSSNISVVPDVGNRTSSQLATLKLFRRSLTLTWPTANAWVRHFSVRADLVSRQTLSMTAWAHSTLAAQHSSKTIASSESPPPGRRSTASGTTRGLSIPSVPSPTNQVCPKTNTLLPIMI
jgi:hypothetical protein